MVPEWKWELVQARQEADGGAVTLACDPPKTESSKDVSDDARTGEVGGVAREDHRATGARIIGCLLQEQEACGDG